MKKAAFRERLQRLEAALGAGPYFAGADFQMVDAMFVPGDFSGRSSQAVAHRYRS
ncbi:glutathione S-transferase domain-containing protein [Rhizobium leguminosarum]|uniref:glutathione S-transferase domain-containing protein n=1 Tax=Rhizobium leguminosarum TaxID=384 RepID=UPI0013D9943F|nr:glutathione S-transferase domain-containing protein [Rhizobium leguminosarum]